MTDTSDTNFVATANWGDEVETEEKDGVEGLVYAAVMMWDEAAAAGTQGQRPSIALKNHEGTNIGTIGFGHKDMDVVLLSIDVARRSVGL
jgi:hypothetical protein